MAEYKSRYSIYFSTLQKMMSCGLLMQLVSIEGGRMPRGCGSIKILFQHGF